jgi:class 3 adenylate cyclase/peroxiredoxin/tetratricopeptide (TPR) repeat protein
MVNALYAPIIQMIVEYGGYVERFAGDALICVFDDVTKAVVCTTMVSSKYASHEQSQGVMLSMHCAVDMAELTYLYCGGFREKWMRLVISDGFQRLEGLLAHSRAGETVVSSAVWAKVSASGVVATELEHAPGKFLISGVGNCASATATIATSSCSMSVLRQFVHPLVIEYVEKSIERYLTSVRTLTTLFIRLAPSLTADVPALMKALSVIQEGIEQYDGFMANSLSDEKGVIVVAAFGFPSTKTDDCIRACKAALFISAKLGTLVMIGVARGESFCGFVGSEARRDVTVMGFPVVVAARLMQSATPGTIVCAHSVLETCGHLMEFTDVRLACIKGHQREVKVGTLAGERPSQSTVESNDVLIEMKNPSSLPSCVNAFFAQDVSNLRNLLETSNCIRIVANELMSPVSVVYGACGRNYRVLHHTCASYETDDPFCALRSVMLRCISHDFSLLTGIQRRELIADLIGEEDAMFLPLLADIFAFRSSSVQSDASLSEPMSEKRQLQVIVRLMRGILQTVTQQSGQLVLAFSHAEHMDRWSRTYMCEVVKQMTCEFRVVLIADDVERLDVGLPRLDDHTIYLNRASDELGLSEFIRSALVAKQLCPELSKVLYHKSSGFLVPCYETLTWIRKEKLLSYDHAPEGLAVAVNVELPILMSLLETFSTGMSADLNRTIDALSPEHAIVVKVCALFATTEFDVDDLVAVFPEDSLKDRVLNLVSELCDFGVFKESQIADRTYVFANAALKQMAAGLLSPVETQKVHEALAQHWEAMKERLPASEAYQRIGHHWLMSISSTVNDADERTRAAAAAAHCAFSAEGRLHMASYEFARASIAWEHCLTLLHQYPAAFDLNSTGKCDLVAECAISLVRCLNMSMQKRDAVRAVQVLSNLIDSSPSSSYIFDIHYGIWLSAYRFALPVPHFSTLDAIAERTLESAISPLEKVHAHRACALTYQKLGQYKLVLEHVEQAVQIYEQNSGELDNAIESAVRFSSLDPIVQLMLLGSRLHWARSSISTGVGLQSQAISRFLTESSAAGDGEMSSMVRTLTAVNLALACHNSALRRDVEEVDRISRRLVEMLKTSPGHLLQLRLQMEALQAWCEFKKTGERSALELMTSLVDRVAAPDNILRLLAAECLLPYDGDYQYLLDLALESCELNQRDLLPEALRIQALADMARCKPHDMDYAAEQRVEEVCYRAVSLSSREDAIALELRALLPLEQLWLAKQRNAKQGHQLLARALEKVHEENEDSRAAREMLETLQQLSLTDQKNYAPTNDQIDAMLQQIVLQLAALKGVPTAVLEAALQTIKDEHIALREQIEKDVLKTGDVVPTVEAVSITGKPVSLSALLKRGPVVLSFFRGSWCPACNISMNILTDQMPLIQSYGTTLLFVTTSGGSDFLDRYHPNCNLVEDADFKISESFKLVYECPPKTRDVYTFAGMRPDIAHGHEGDWRLPVTATYIINEDGVIVDGRWYANGMFRMSVDEILVTLQRLHEEKQRKLALESHNSLLESVDL